MRAAQTTVVSARARASVRRGKSARKVSSRKPPGDETSRALFEEMRTVVTCARGCLRKRADANTRLRSATSKGEEMMNDECGMMNERQRVSRHSSFRIHRSSFVSASGATPVESVARGEREAEAEDDECDDEQRPDVRQREQHGPDDSAEQERDRLGALAFGQEHSL